MSNVYINRDKSSLWFLAGKKDLVGAEIGTEKGYGADSILSCFDIKKLYLIDPYFCNKEDMQISDIVLKNYSDKIVRIFEPSNTAHKYIKDNELDFVYIDGDHSYETVKEDIVLYYNKVKVDGFIFGHDYKEGEMGVVKAVNELLSGYRVGFAGKWDWYIVKRFNTLVRK